MKKTQLIECLHDLSGEEEKRFLHFLESPYFNRNERLPRLLNLLLEGGEGLDKQTLFEGLFPGETFQDQLLRNELSYLFRQLKQFLMLERWQERGIYRHSLLLEVAAERAWDRLFETEEKRLQKQLNQAEEQNLSWYQTQMEIAQAKNQRFGRAFVRKENEALATKHHFLDLTYLIEKLKEAAESLNRAYLFNQSVNLSLADTLADWLETNPNPYIQEPLLHLYLRVFRMWQQPDHFPHFQQLRDQLHDLPSTLPQSEARALFLHAQNFCTRQINAGNSAFLQEIFSLYQASLRQEVALVQGELPHTTFKNICTVGLRLKEFDWVESFLESYQHKVPERDRINVHSFCLASYWFASGRSRQALKLLGQVQFTDVPYEISGRELLLKCLWALEDEDGLDYQREALQIYLRRNRQLSKERRASHLNFLKAIRQLSRYREGRLNRADWEALPGIWQAMDQLSHRDWLLEEAGLLRGERRDVGVADSKK